jgi:carboxypeptidase Taq
VSGALERLKDRAAEIHTLRGLHRLLEWDQLVIMPPAGAGHRADHLALLGRLEHEWLSDPELGRLLDELAPTEASLDPDSDDAGLLRFVRREHEKAVRVPAALREEMARASTEAKVIWQEARASSNFEFFLPQLERSFDLRRRYIACFDTTDQPYDVVLDDYEPDLTTPEVAGLFDEIKDELVPLIAELRDRDDGSVLTGPFPVEVQIALCEEIVGLLGYRPGTWRLDPTAHPFASGPGIDDVRITTHYHEQTLGSFFATVHEFGHGLYEHQIPRRFAHLPIGAGWLSGLHESQSRLFENMVGRSLPFWRFFYPRLQEYFPERFRGVELDRFYAAVNSVRPSLIRIHADEVTYPMHVIMRFELEQAILDGDVELRDLPRLWAEKIDTYLGIGVPDDARGVLQDIHWSWGLIGYFPTYLLGSVMSVQFWEQAATDVRDLEERVERGDFAALREWLGENVHAWGRKLTPQEILERATGSRIDARPYLDYLGEKYRAAVAV